MTAPARALFAAMLAPALAIGGCSGSPGEDDGPGPEVRALTGAHTRLVWVQHDGSDPSAEGDQLIMMGLDTDDGRGEHVILQDRRSYVRPLLTSDGTRIVFSTRPVPGPPEAYVLNWDGSGLRKFADGFVLDLWESPIDGREWVYLGTDNTEWNFAKVTRFPLDDPDRQELVWDRTPVSMDTFQVSADGRRAGGLWPWPDAGVATLPNGPLETFGNGCFTSLTNGRGPLFWYFDGAHRNLTMVDVPTKARWVVNINGAPGFDGAEVNQPRWTHHPRFFAMTGPYNQGGPNQARTGGPQAEVYLGRFSADFSTVEAWARATVNEQGDSYPDVWIDLDESPHPTFPPGPVGPAHVRTAGAGAAPAAPLETGRLVVNVRLTRPAQVPAPEAILPYRNALVVNEYEVMDVIDGSYAESTIRIAQWAIQDGRTLAGAHKLAGAGFTLTVERYDAHPELEGERLISESETSALPLYYDPRVE